MTEKNNDFNLATGFNCVQNVYEGTVNARVVERVGNLPTSQRKGIAHEIIYANKLNVTRPDLGVTKLSANTNAIRDDLVSIKDGVVKHRAQLKDTISPAGVKKTLNQGASGKYSGTNLMGTKETTELYNEAAKYTSAQKMSSTGISSKDTSRIVESFSGKMPSLESVAHNSTRAGSFAAATVAGKVVMDATDGEVKEVLEDIGRGVGEVVSDVGDAADEIVYQVMDSIGEGLDRVGEKVDDFIDGVSLFFNLF